MSKLIKPSEVEETQITSEQNKVTLTIECTLHPADMDRLHDNIHEFLKTCAISEQYAEKFNREVPKS